MDAAELKRPPFVAKAPSAQADPKEAGEIMHEYHREIDVDRHRRNEESREFAARPNAPLGAMDPGRVQKTIDMVAATFPLQKNVAPADVYAPGFLPN